MWINAQTLRKAEKYVYSNFTETGFLFTNYTLNHIKIIMVSVCGFLTIILIVIVIAITYMSRFCQRLRKRRKSLKMTNDELALNDMNNINLNSDNDSGNVVGVNDVGIDNGSGAGGYTLDNLAIPTVYTETNVICNEYYSQILSGYNSKETKSNMELLSLDLYSINPTATTTNEGPPDLIPTFYYNTSANDRDLMGNINS